MAVSGAKKAAAAESTAARREREAQTGVEMTVVDIGDGNAIRVRKGEEKSFTRPPASEPRVREHVEIIEMIEVGGFRYRADDTDGIAAAKKRLAAANKERAAGADKSA